MIEYKKYYLLGEDEIDMLDKMGRKGWELCAIFGSAYYFKRKVEVKNLAQPDVSSSDACPECHYENGEHKHGCKEYYSGR